MQGSQNQFKEVWEEADGLDPEDFDPKTFFKLHGKSSSIDITGGGQGHPSQSSSTFSRFELSDSNGDGFFDEQELEALFTKEVKICPIFFNVSPVMIMKRVHV